MLRSFSHSSRGTTRRRTKQHAILVVSQPSCNLPCFDNGLDDGRLTAAGTAGNYGHILDIRAEHCPNRVFLRIVQREPILRLDNFNGIIHILTVHQAEGRVRVRVNHRTEIRDVALIEPVFVQIHAEHRLSAVRRLRPLHNDQTVFSCYRGCFPYHFVRERNFMQDIPHRFFDDTVHVIYPDKGIACHLRLRFKSIEENCRHTPDIVTRNLTTAQRDFICRSKSDT